LHFHSFSLAARRRRIAAATVFFHHGFFRPFFFFGAPVFAPVPLAFYPPTPYPSYLYAPMEGYPGCYEYQTTAVVNDQLAPAWGMACLQPDGTWRVVN
jgi:hypothetical protein